MNKEPFNKSPFSYLQKPWVIETIFFFLVLWQESFRLSSRTAHRTLPIRNALQNYYYYNSGDFVNGFGIAYIADGLINFIFLKVNPYYTILGLHITKRKNAFLATLFSILVVVTYELAQSTSTTSDVNDIPAGVLGAVFYFIVRWFALKNNEKQERQRK